MNTQTMTERELIIMRDALKEYAIGMRTDPDTRKVTSEADYLKRDLSPNARYTYLTALAMAAEAAARIR